ncbi:MAG: tetratricopeptide repeat protein [Chitinophagales bacterium]
MILNRSFFPDAKKIVMAILIILVSHEFMEAQVPLSTQPEKTQTREGNKEYQQENFAEAEASYKKALDHKNNMPEATFNLGDAVYEQKRYEDAQKQFQLSAKTNADPTVKAKAFHNLGNSYLSQKKWEDAVEAYKNALKINPADADTKYNLAYANAMLNKNNGGGGQNNKDQEQKDQQQNKDQKDQQQQKNDQQKDQDKKKDQQQSNNQDQKEQQPQQGQQPKLSKQEAEQLLAAMENEEQKTTQKMQKKQMKAVKVKIKKDW